MCEMRFRTLFPRNSHKSSLMIISSIPICFCIGSWRFLCYKNSCETCASSMLITLLSSPYPAKLSISVDVERRQKTVLLCLPMIMIIKRRDEPLNFNPISILNGLKTLFKVLQHQTSQYGNIVNLI